MNLPNALSFSRIALSPVFFFLFFVNEWFGVEIRTALLVSLWGLFALIEITDLLDGYVARLSKSETDLGKALDPFADSLSRLTYFACFALAGIMPAWVFMLVLYRDLGVAFIRQRVSTKGGVMASRLSGKLKAWVYAFGGAAGLLAFSSGGMNSILHTVVQITFYLCAAVAVWSLIDYISSARMED